MEQLDFMSALGCQRWRQGRDSYRPAGEPIDTTKYGVELIEERQARDFVSKHHYAGSLPPTRVRVGLFRAEPFKRSELVGAAVFSVPVQARALTHYFGCGNEAGVELGRLVLTDCVPANGETFFVSRACRLLKQQLPGIKAVLSYSDPVERRSATGELVKRGHFGVLYRALSASFLGRSSKRTLILDQGGRVLSERTMSKLRNDEAGAGGAYRLMLAAGAPSRQVGESGEDYVKRALATGPFRRVRHPGNFAFGWGVGSKSDRAFVRKSMSPVPYPAYPIT